MGIVVVNFAHYIYGSFYKSSSVLYLVKNGLLLSLISCCCYAQNPGKTLEVKSDEITLIFEKRDHSMDTLHNENGSSKLLLNPVISYQVANDFIIFELKPDNRIEIDTIRLQNIDSLILRHYFNFSLFTYYKIRKGDHVRFTYLCSIVSLITVLIV